MPIYEYECTCCPSKFELKRSFHDEGAVNCPNCGGKARKRFSSVPIIFKGSGFYVTDTRGGQSYTSSASPTEEKSGTTEAGTTASEPKAAKAEKVEAKVPAKKSKA